MVFRDHCHKSGEHRGTLCNRCNITLSNHNDDPISLKAKSVALRTEAAYIYERIKGHSIYERLEKTIADQKMVRADLLDALAEYILRA